MNSDVACVPCGEHGSRRAGPEVNSSPFQSAVFAITKPPPVNWVEREAARTPSFSSLGIRQISNWRRDYIPEDSEFSKKRLALAFAIAGVSDIIGAFATLAPPVVWVVDLGTALLLFVVLGWQWLLLPGLALEAIPGVGVLPFWLLVVGAIAVLGTPRPKFDQR